MSPLRAVFSFHGPVGLVGVSPVGLQIQVFGGLICQVLVLKVGVPDVGYEPCTPWGEVPGLRSLLTACSRAWGGVYGESASQPFLSASV